MVFLLLLLWVGVICTGRGGVCPKNDLFYNDARCVLKPVVLVGKVVDAVVMEEKVDEGDDGDDVDDVPTIADEWCG